MRTITRGLIVALALVGGVTTQAFAQANPFAIDQIITDAQNAYPANTTGQALAVIDPNSNVKELGPINASTTKLGVINSAGLPMLGVTNPNAQVDLNRVYSTSAVSGPILWFYFGWARDSNSGSGFISIELQKNAPPVACAYSTMTEAQLIAGCDPWAGRQDGDILILWDQSGSGTAISARLYNAALQQFGPPIPLAQAEAVAAYSADKFRGEVAININAIVAGQQDQCLTFANIIPGTVTGNSDSADYKDTVLSAFPLASNCGTVTINKVTQDGLGNAFTGPTSAGPFPFTLTAGTTPIFGATPDATVCSTTATSATCSGALAQGGSSVAVSNLLARTNYTLTEGTIDPKWTQVSILCGGSPIPAGGFSVPAGSNVSCTITNKLVNGKLIIIKQVVNNNGGTATAGQFTMTINGAGVGGGVVSPGTEYSIAAGTIYAVDENTNGIVGYSKTLSTQCTGTIEPNVTRTCTVINDDIAPSLNLVKVVHNTAGGTTTAAAFSLTATGPTTITGSGNVQSGATFSAGAYALTEGSVAGYSVETNWVCTGPAGTTNQTGGSVTIALGQAWTCTIVNKDSKASPTGATAQRALLNDTMTITGIRAGASDAGSATVIFKLFSENTCLTTPLLTESRPVSGGAASTAVGYLTTVSGTFYWTAVYSGDAFNNGVTKACGSEITTVNLQQ